MAFKNDTVSVLPIKNKTIKIKNRYFNYIVFNYKQDVYLTKRTEKDIWQNLYEFLLIETDAESSEQAILNHKTLTKLVPEFTVSSIVKSKKHILSHQHLYATFYELKINKPLKHTSLFKIKRSELEVYALPQLINKYLDTK